MQDKGNCASVPWPLSSLELHFGHVTLPFLPFCHWQQRWCLLSHCPPRLDTDLRTLIICFTSFGGAYLIIVQKLLHCKACHFKTCIKMGKGSEGWQLLPRSRWCTWKTVKVETKAKRYTDATDRHHEHRPTLVLGMQKRKLLILIRSLFVYMWTTSWCMSLKTEHDNIIFTAAVAYLAKHDLKLCMLTCRKPAPTVCAICGMCKYMVLARGRGLLCACCHIACSGVCWSCDDDTVSVLWLLVSVAFG